MYRYRCYDDNALVFIAASFSSSLSRSATFLLCADCIRCCEKTQNVKIKRCSASSERHDVPADDDPSSSSHLPPLLRRLLLSSRPAQHPHTAPSSSSRVPLPLPFPSSCLACALLEPCWLLRGIRTGRGIAGVGRAVSVRGIVQVSLEPFRIGVARMALRRAS